MKRKDIKIERRVVQGLCKVCHRFFSFTEPVVVGKKGKPKPVPGDLCPEHLFDRMVEAANGH